MDFLNTCTQIATSLFTFLTSLFNFWTGTAILGSFFGLMIARKIVNLIRKIY